METTMIRDAERKARYGHRDWVYWRDAAGTLHVELLTVESCQQALDAAGQDGHFSIIEANVAHHHLINPEIGRNWLANLKMGIQ